MPKVAFDNLELSTWLAVNNASVNPVQLKDIVPELIQPAGEDPYLEVAVVADKPYGGGLVHLSLPFPQLQGFTLGYVGVDMLFRLPEDAAQYLRCLEVDCKVCATAAPNATTPIPNVMDGSGQIALYDANQIQIDNAPPASTWINTGQTAPALPPDTWIPWSSRYMADYANKKGSVSGFNIAGKACPVPANLQGLPFMSTNWGQAVELQQQVDCNDKPGTFSVHYKAIRVTFSDRPF